MKTRPLNKTLRKLAGHLVVETDEQQRSFESLYKFLAQAELPTDTSKLMQSDFSIAKADFFFDETIPNQRIDALDKLAQKKLKSRVKPRYRVFVREVPVRDPLLYASVPDWAAGAQVSQSIGPFAYKDGRQFWYDFLPFAKLTALYIQGVAEPVLLYKVRRSRKGSARASARSSQTRTYTLVKGSIWINSRFIAPNSPTGTYIGLTINGGRLALSKTPVIQGGKLTVAVNTKISVQLKLNQADPPDADSNSPYGVDARKLKLELPEQLSFHFSGQGRTVEAVGDAQWNLYGQSLKFSWDSQSQTTYDPLLKRVIFPFTASAQNVRIRRSQSKFNTIRGSADIIRSAWALPVAAIDIQQPTEAAGTGAMLVQTKEGLVNGWQKLAGGGINLAKPAFLVSPGQILLADMTGGNPHARQSLNLWQDRMNTFGTKVDLTFPFPALFFYAASANGSELFMTFANADFQVDRPVKVNGSPPTVRSLNSLLVVAVTTSRKLIYLFDDNMIQDAAQLSSDDPSVPAPMALALTNALLKVSQVNGCLLFGNLSDDFSKVQSGFLFLTFGLYAYLPTLPDPYAANLGVLRRHIRGRGNVAGTTAATGYPSASQITAWLVSRVRWLDPAQDEIHDDVEVSFHFAPLSNQFGGISLEDNKDDASVDDSISASASRSTATAAVKTDSFSPITDPSISRLNLGISNATGAIDADAERDNDIAAGAPATTRAAISGHSKPLPDYEDQWDKFTGRFRRNLFTLLDVSTNADLYGIGFNLFSRDDTSITTHVPAASSTNTFPIQVKGMDVVSQGQNVKAFTVPQMSWEPVMNLSPPQPGSPGDPQIGPNYYPNDGGSTQILNNSDDSVALAPIPNNRFLAHHMANTDGFTALSFFTLPFGMKALALLQKEYDSGGGNTRRGGILQLAFEKFNDHMKAAIQLSLIGGAAQAPVESDMFAGRTVQLANVLNFGGSPPLQPKSTLGEDVTKIFNQEFSPPSGGIAIQRGVPLERIDLSGYGASAFSNWLNPKAAIAETSQAKFDIFVGRCAHEVIQVKSIMYPWAIRVVRTITLFRVGSGYVYRFDTGWRAESNGQFNFKYFVKKDDGSGNLTSIPKSAGFEIHPGIVKGLFNVTDIVGTDEIDTFISTVVPDYLVNESTGEGTPNVGNVSKPVELRPVFFNADVEIENPTSGFNRKKIIVINSQGDQIEVEKSVVPAKKILGFVQISPRGVPITSQVLRQLVLKHGTIGGPIDCEVNLANSDQKMRLNRFDFNNSFGANGTDIVFAAAGRGNVLLPKDGSWSLIKHDRDTGEVSPVAANLSVPAIREGMLEEDGESQKLNKPIENVLLRIANPTELLRAPVDDTLNFGFVQNTDTQKALFLTPSFEMGQKKLFSKTPPLFVDAFRIVNSKSIFPNIGKAEINDFGDAISLISQTGTEFIKGALQDIGQDVWELMDITGAAQNALDQGYNLLKKVANFDLPELEFELIDVGDGNFRIYIEYKQKDDEPPLDKKGTLDFNINSLANDMAETWKSHMGNIGLVVDLAGIERLMTIRGSWDSKKGSEAAYPQPDIKFSKELQPVIDILEILQQLQDNNYAGAVANGLKLAMSNKAGTWEYKFEASKEIPVLRFPPGPAYNDPNAPFKLEAGLTIGAYFNAALKVTSSANELLPSAGGLLGFYGRLSVMCVSLSAATVYAIGQVNLDIAADTKIGPSLRMKFGFGAQIVIGLPVAGNVSVLFVVGVEIFAASGIIEVTAFMLFEGHAEILGGLVSITIRIEAKGTISKKQIGASDESRTDLACQVTFGLDISIFLVINISFETSWSEQRQIA